MKVENMSPLIFSGIKNLEKFYGEKGWDVSTIFDMLVGVQLQGFPVGISVPHCY